MDGKLVFREACGAAGIDCDTYFKIGCQCGENNAGYVYKCPATSRNESQLYAVNYITPLGLYVAWFLKEGKKEKYESFRVLKSALTAYNPGEVFSVPKPLEYPVNIPGCESSLSAVQSNPSAQ